MSDCLFCRIVSGEIPSTKVYEDETCFAFRDINPQAKVHVILVPREHVADWTEAAEKLSDVTLARMMRAAARIAADEGLKNGYRVISNCGSDACQSVKHWHIHILGGERLNDRMA